MEDDIHYVKVLVGVKSFTSVVIAMTRVGLWSTIMCLMSALSCCTWIKKTIAMFSTHLMVQGKEIRSNEGEGIATFASLGRH